MQGPFELNRRRVVGGLLIVFFVVGLYFLVPKLAGLNQTWGRLKRGDPALLVFGAVLELLSIAGYAALFRTVFGRGEARIDWRASVEIPLAGIAAIRLLAAAGAGGVAVTAWALRQAGMAPPVIACRMVASYVLQYAVYLGAVIVCGCGLTLGLLRGSTPFELTVIPAAFSLAVAGLVVSMALLPHDFQRRLERVGDRSGRVGRLAMRFATVPAALGDGVRTALALVRARRLGLLGAVAYWGFDIAVLGVSFRAFGASVPVVVLVMGYFLGTLGSLLPLPGGVGGVEGGMIGAFAAFGVPGSRALVAAP